MEPDVINQTIKTNIGNTIFRTKLGKVIDTGKYDHPSMLKFIVNLQSMSEILSQYGYSVDFMNIQNKLVCSIFNSKEEENEYSLYFDYDDNVAGIFDTALNVILPVDSDIDLLFNMFTSGYLKILP